MKRTMNTTQGQATEPVTLSVTSVLNGIARTLYYFSEDDRYTIDSITYNYHAQPYSITVNMSDGRQYDLSVSEPYMDPNKNRYTCYD